MSLITEAQSAAWFANRGLAGEQPDEATCTHCHDAPSRTSSSPLDGQDVCLPCLYLLTGDDPYAPDNARDLGQAGAVAVLVIAFVLGFVFLVLLHLGQAVMCSAHDQSLRYCDGYSHTTTEETP